MSLGDLYGFGTFDADIVDDRHTFLCTGCPACDAAEARWERIEMRQRADAARYANA